MNLAGYERERRLLGGRYATERVLGQGAHGRVYLAHDVKAQRRVALKEFSALAGEDTFMREIGAVFDLAHPAVVRADSVFMEQGLRYLVYEYMELGSLRERINLGTEVVATLELVREAAAGVAYAHARNVLHRDLKPENILVTRSGGGLRAKVTDFGISALGVEAATRSNSGSPAYMAPEQFYDSYDRRVDVYSLGVVVYEILCGQRPFAGTPAQIMLAHLEREPVLPEWLPPRMRLLLERSLAKRPEDRFDTVDAWISALTLALRDEASEFVNERWPLYAPGVEELALTPYALLLRTGRDVSRHGPRGDAQEAHSDVDEMLAHGEYFALRHGNEVRVHGPHGPVRGMRVRPGACIALGPRGEIAVATEGKARIAGGREEQRAPVELGQRITALAVGASGALALAGVAGGGACVMFEARKIAVDAHVQRLWVHDDGQILVADVSGAEGRVLLLSAAGTRSVRLPARPSAFDGQRLYGIEKEGSLYSFDVRTGARARTALDQPIVGLAANASSLAWVDAQGRVERIPFSGGDA